MKNRNLFELVLKQIPATSKVKRDIAKRILLNGESRERIIKELSKGRKNTVNAQAFVTMVENIIEQCKKKIKVKTNYDGKEKIIVRHAFNYNVLGSKLLTGMVLTLSSWECIMEKKLHEAFKGLFFMACEKEGFVFEDLVKTIEDEKLHYISPMKTDVGAIINKLGRNSLAHAILDYCITLQSVENDIKTIMNKNIVKQGGLILITVAQRNAEKGYNTKEELNKLINDNGGNKYKVVYEKGYSEKGNREKGVKKGMPMLTIIVKRIK